MLFSNTNIIKFMETFTLNTKLFELSQLDSVYLLLCIPSTYICSLFQSPKTKKYELRIFFFGLIHKSLMINE